MMRALIRALAERPGTILSRSQLEDRLYDWGNEVESNAVDVLIHYVRRKFDKDIIRNVRGIDVQLRHDVFNRLDVFVWSADNERVRALVGDRHNARGRGPRFAVSRSVLTSAHATTDVTTTTQWPASTEPR